MTLASVTHSRFVQRVRRRWSPEIGAFEALLAGAPAAPIGPDTIAALVQQLQRDGRELPAALRVARHLVVERLAVLDIEHDAPLATVTLTMTALAEATLEAALVRAQAEADARHGPPLAADGSRVDFWVVGMGKLGARELNVSSDIDLVYVYGDAGEGAPALTAGPRPVSVHEHATAVARRLTALIGETTEDGIVFRVDLALRPNGLSGPPVVSLPMLDDYFQAQGREWERFAWLKSRVVAPLHSVGQPQALALRALVTPFVYRRYLDYGIFEGLRQLHRKIRDEAQRRAAGRPERANDVKLSRGGIREIEFTVQLMQVVRGGQYPEIRTRSTLKALQRLAERGLMKADAAEKLATGYTFLRRLEHRIQFLDDQQTHQMPGADADLEWIAHSMGFGRAFEAAAVPADLASSTGNAYACPDSSELLSCLMAVRETVAAEFDALLREGQGATGHGLSGAARGSDDAAPGCRGCTPNSVAVSIDNACLQDGLPAALAARLSAFAASPRVQRLRDDARMRLGRLAQRTAQALHEGSCSEAAALRFIDWLEPLLRRESYLALLVERSDVQQRLLRLLGLARWPMRYLMQHPGVIDELADERQLHDRFDRAGFEAELEGRRSAYARAGEDGDDQLLDMLRHAHHAEVFRTLVRDVEGRISVEQVADDLSALADAVLTLTLRWAWSRLKQRHRDVPGLAVLAYGKLGGLELSYGSDLDVVFLYDDGDEPDKVTAQEVYAAFVRKLVTWLTLRTAAGELFDIDTALRPNGNSGLLVTSLDAFEKYQVGRGSNTAWTWEHQALTRARVAAGPAAVQARFDAIRSTVLTSSRDATKLREEVRAMRAQVGAARPVRAGRFDVKHSPGGMMDVEFAVQALVLALAAQHPALLANAGNIALLQRAESAGLLPPGVGHGAADAYRELRRAQHTARLDEQPTDFDGGAFGRERQAVQALWLAVFGDPAVVAARR